MYITMGDRCVTTRRIYKRSPMVIYMWIFTPTIRDRVLVIDFPMASTWNWQRHWPGRHEDHLVVVKVRAKADASATSIQIDGSSMRNRNVRLVWQLEALVRVKRNCQACVKMGLHGVEKLIYSRVVDILMAGGLRKMPFDIERRRSFKRSRFRPFRL
jgi:hypothetical protein